MIENFQEGWFHESLFLNVGLMFVQYLSPMIIFASLTGLAIAFPRVGSFAHLLTGLLLLISLRSERPRSLALSHAADAFTRNCLLVWSPAATSHSLPVSDRTPVLTLIACGIEPVVRVAGRVDDGNLPTPCCGRQRSAVDVGGRWPRLAPRGSDLGRSRGGANFSPKAGGSWLMFRKISGDCQAWKKQCVPCRVTASTAAGFGKRNGPLTECGPTKNHRFGMSTRR